MITDLCVRFYYTHHVGTCIPAMSTLLERAGYGGREGLLMERKTGLCIGRMHASQFYPEDGIIYVDLTDIVQEIHTLKYFLYAPAWIKKVKHQYNKQDQCGSAFS